MAFTVVITLLLGNLRLLKFRGGMQQEEKTKMLGIQLIFLSKTFKKSLLVYRFTRDF